MTLWERLWISWQAAGLLSQLHHRAKVEELKEIPKKISYNYWSRTPENVDMRSCLIRKFVGGKSSIRFGDSEERMQLRWNRTDCDRVLEVSCCRLTLLKVRRDRSSSGVFILPSFAEFAILHQGEL